MLIIIIIIIIQDTGFNIGTNDVTIDIKVDSNEFSLQGKKNKSV